MKGRNLLEMLLYLKIVFLPLNCRNLLEISCMVCHRTAGICWAAAGICWKCLDLLEMPSLICLDRHRKGMPSLICLDRHWKDMLSKKFAIRDWLAANNTLLGQGDRQITIYCYTKRGARSTFSPLAIQLFWRRNFYRNCGEDACKTGDIRKEAVGNALISACMSPTMERHAI